MRFVLNVPRPSLAILELFLAVIFPFGVAQASQSSTICGKAKLSLASPTYLVAGSVIVAVELPSGWVREEGKRSPFFLLRAGDRSETATTLIYVNVQRLSSSFDQAVSNDAREFRMSDPSVQITDEPTPEILESDCPAKTQRFVYQQNHKTYVDEVTKIGINGLLLNVVLSSEGGPEIERYQMEYQFVLKHLALVAPAE